MIFNLIWRIGELIGWLFVYARIYQYAKPSSYQSSNPVQAKHVRYIPLQMVSLCHALLTVCYGLGYVVGFWPEQTLWGARIASTAYLFFDMFESWRLWLEKQRFDTKTQERGLSAWQYDGHSISGKKAAALVNHDPAIKTFHHICTLLFMYGFFFKSDITGCVLYFIGEIPVLFLNIAKCFSYMGMDGHTSAMLCNWLGVVTYALCRILCFPLVFVFAMLPFMNVFNLFAWLFLICLVFVYLLNVITFAFLMDDRRMALPFTLKQVADLAIHLMGLFASAQQQAVKRQQHSSDKNASLQV